MRFTELRRRLHGHSVAMIWAIGLGGLLLRLWAVQEYRPTCELPGEQCRQVFGDDVYVIGGDAIYIHAQSNLIADGEWFVNPFFYSGGFVLDSAGEIMTTLNPVGAILWGWLPADLDTLVVRLHGRFPDVEQDVLLTDARQFLSDLETAGLIARTDAST